MRKNLAIAIFAGCVIASPVLAQHNTPQRGQGPQSPQPYAGQHTRAVTTLSAEDVEALLAGRGWGLAKPAELNGFPGPMHVMELADQLELTEQQHKRVEQIFNRMKQRAIAIGPRYVAAEAALDQVFKSGAAYNSNALQSRLRAAERLRSELRRVHLQAHVETTPLLTEPQRMKYVELRGYSGVAHAGHQQHHKH
jgi:Spy/CpxP family protein refolding chaperone